MLAPARPSLSLDRLGQPLRLALAYRAARISFPTSPQPSNADGDDPNGYDPRGGVIFDNQGALYGMTEDGGTFGNGVVFKLTPPAKGQSAWTETVLHSFCSLANCSDGVNPTFGS